MKITCYCTRTVTFTVSINLFQNKMLNNGAGKIVQGEKCFSVSIKSED